MTHTKHETADNKASQLDPQSLPVQSEGMSVKQFDTPDEIQKGEIVRVGEGPYEGFDAIVESIDRTAGTAELFPAVFGGTDVKLITVRLTALTPTDP